ncbi:MAG: helix-turn-helix domain-containing protein [Anaerolineae bacterium]|nr:helix-turn-helix domain-containing protein [Anaerolineae bacterium]
MRSHDRDFVGSLEKGLLLIEAFDVNQPRLTVAEAARRADLTRAAARRYLLTLVALNYAETDGKHFWLCPKVLRLGYAFLSTASLPKIAQPILDQIGTKTKEVTSLHTLVDSEIVCLAHSAIRRMVAATSNIGMRLPAYSSAAGRVILASWSDEAVIAYLKSIKRERLTPMTMTRLEDLMAEIAQVRANGYAISDEELEIGLRAIAVPLADSRGEVHFALAVSVLAAHLSVEEMVRNILPQLLSGKKVIEQSL